MSEMVFYKGTLTKINNGKTFKENCIEICKDIDKNTLADYESLQQYISEEFYDKYYIYENQLYKMKVKSVDLDNDIFNANMDKSGKIKFEVKYYNGGCGFNEAMDEAMDSMKKGDR